VADLARASGDAGVEVVDSAVEEFGEPCAVFGGDGGCGHGWLLRWLVICVSYSLTNVGLWHKGFGGFLGTCFAGSRPGSGGSGHGRDSTERQAKPFPIGLGLACRRSVDGIEGDVESAEWGTPPDCGLSVRSPVDEEGCPWDIPFRGVALGDFDALFGFWFSEDWQVAPSGPAVVEVVDSGGGVVVVNAGPPLAVGAVDAVDEVAGARASGAAMVAASEVGGDGVGGVGAVGAVGANDGRVPHIAVYVTAKASVAVNPDLHGVGEIVGGQSRVGGEVDGEVFGTFFAVGGVDDAEDVELPFGGFHGHGDRLLWLVV